MMLLASAFESGCFFTAFFAAVVTTLVVVGIFQANKRHDVLRGVARRMNGAYESGGMFTRAHLDFVVSGRRARFEFFPGGDDSSPYTRLEVTLKDPSPGTLHILPDGFGQSFLKMFGAQDIEIGDPSFDAEYVIKATPESLAARVFSPDLRARVIAAVRRLSNLSHPTIDLERHTLRIQVREHCTVEGRLLVMVQTAEDFLKHLFGAPAPAGEPGIQWGELQTLTGGECPVCGTKMDDLVVRCAACRTPHHAECWEYAGKCSMFACAGKKFVA